VYAHTKKGIVNNVPIIKKNIGVHIEMNPFDGKIINANPPAAEISCPKSILTRNCNHLGLISAPQL